MKRFRVTYITEFEIEVEADTEEQAIEIASTSHEDDWSPSRTLAYEADEI